jgi:hypothetical protein
VNLASARLLRRLNAAQNPRISRSLQRRIRLLDFDRFLAKATRILKEQRLEKEKQLEKTKKG